MTAQCFTFVGSRSLKISCIYVKYTHKQVKNTRGKKCTTQRLEHDWNMHILVSSHIFRLYTVATTTAATTSHTTKPEQLNNILSILTGCILIGVDFVRNVLPDRPFRASHSVPELPARKA